MLGVIGKLLVAAAVGSLFTSKVEAVVLSCGGNTRLGTTKPNCSSAMNSCPTGDTCPANCPQQHFQNTCINSNQCQQTTQCCAVGQCYCAATNTCAELPLVVSGVVAAPRHDVRAEADSPFKVNANTLAVPLDEKQSTQVSPGFPVGITLATFVQCSFTFLLSLTGAVAHPLMPR